MGLNATDLCNENLCLYRVQKLSLLSRKKKPQRTNGPVNAHLISWPSKAQDIQNLENIW